jgi:hypothetical protein
MTMYVQNYKQRLRSALQYFHCSIGFRHYCVRYNTTRFSCRRCTWSAE